MAEAELARPVSGADEASAKPASTAAGSRPRAPGSRRGKLGANGSPATAAPWATRRTASASAPSSRATARRTASGHRAGRRDARAAVAPLRGAARQLVEQERVAAAGLEQPVGSPEGCRSRSSSPASSRFSGPRRTRSSPGASPTSSRPDSSGGAWACRKEPAPGARARGPAGAPAAPGARATRRRPSAGRRGSGRAAAARRDARGGPGPRAGGGRSSCSRVAPPDANGAMEGSSSPSSSTQSAPRARRSRRSRLPAASSSASTSTPNGRPVSNSAARPVRAVAPRARARRRAPRAASTCRCPARP